MTLGNNLSKTANMIMVDLGIPPGFELLSEDLQSFQEKADGANAGRLEKFSLAATQAILYFNGLGPHQEVTLKVRLRAKYPIRAHTLRSRLYEYYDPDVSSTSRPVKLEVDGRLRRTLSSGEGRDFRAKAQLAATSSGAAYSKSDC